ncbi:Notch-regulated ankyrin repeat-containing protein B [Anabarilius grahami]|uniref:Notch-regulated ankyrin repeat-containing protein B n=2 Tax=Cypriniformes TaxID=7952 RepID=A0A3N0Y8Q3_ANAGA|nr:Notch-regulated ankyrin repeat-containing protein B [Anabarilius grahami]
MISVAFSWGYPSQTERLRVGQEQESVHLEEGGLCRRETEAKGCNRLPVEIMSQADMTCSARQRVFQEALRKGNTKELHSLLQNMTNCEFNVNSFGPEGQTALHQSVIDGNLELVKLLVKFGADIRLTNRDGWSALHIAAFGGHQDIVLYLITRAKYSSSAL